MIKRKRNSKLIKKVGTKMVVFMMTMATVFGGTSLLKVNEAKASDIYIVSGEKKENVKMQFKTAAYSGGSKTASGMPTKRDPKGISTVAVDPSVIPYGTPLYIEGYGYAVAADCGTAIKGKTIDLFFNSYEESANWGIKYVTVTILGNSAEV